MSNVVPLLIPHEAPEADFMALWSLWLGMKRGTCRQDAVRAWAKAVRRASPAAIIAGAERFAAAQAGEDPRFIPHAATWLNGSRWEDDLPELASVLQEKTRSDFDQWCCDWVNKGRSLALRRADADQFVRAMVKAGKIQESQARTAGYL